MRFEGRIDDCIAKIRRGAIPGEQQGTGVVPCCIAEITYFSKFSKAPLSVQASSMMSQSGFS